MYYCFKQINTLIIPRVFRKWTFDDSDRSSLIVVNGRLSIRHRIPFTEHQRQVKDDLSIGVVFFGGDLNRGSAW